MRKWYPILVVILLLVIDNKVSFGHSILTIKHSNGNSNIFAVEIAKSTYERMRGLMYRKSIADDTGMVFVFPEQKVSMWMKNTYIPLDMIFVNNQGKIIKIAKNTVPLSTEHISSNAPVAMVIELKGGATEKFNIQTGDVVTLNPAY